MGTVCQDVFEFQRKKAVQKCGFAPFSMFQHFSRGNFAFFILIGEAEAKLFRDGALGLTLSPSGILHAFSTYVLLCSLYRGSTGLMHQSKEDHEFKAGMCDNKVQNINSRRKHKKLNWLVSKVEVSKRSFLKRVFWHFSFVSFCQKQEKILVLLVGGNFQISASCFCCLSVML